MRSTVLIGLFSVVGVLLGNTAVLAAGTFQGEWEYQALNSGDTNFKVEQKGQKLTLYRVLHPEYQGSRYKLEHIYRGRIQGQKISGDLFVREEGMPDFERLRAFSGRIKSSDTMTMDDLPLKRVGVSPTAPADRVAVADGPKYKKVIIKRKKPEAQTQPKAQPEAKPVQSDRPSDKDKPDSSQKVKDKEPKPAPKVPEAPVRLAQAAPVSIPTLIPVGRKVSPDSRTKKADEFVRRGDEAYAQKRFSPALKHYKAAFAEQKTRVELLYKLGLCHGVLGSQAARDDHRAEARAHYELAIANWQKAFRLDPYNWGAKENIRRAKKKLKSLSD